MAHSGQYEDECGSALAYPPVASQDTTSGEEILFRQEKKI